MFQSDPAHLESIRNIFENLYDQYNDPRWISTDPIQFIYHYNDPADQEIAAFIASALSYGRVKSIQKGLVDLLGRMGKSPRTYVENFTDSDAEELEDFRYRFNTGRNFAHLFSLFQEILGRSQTLEQYFLKGYRSDHPNVLPALESFCRSLVERQQQKTGKPCSRGFRYLLAGPSAGGVSKRLHMFLRWMVRKDNIDTGLWKQVGPEKLIPPLDTHLFRLIRLIGFHNCRTASSNALIDITRAFLQISPRDPVKYDFALTRVGIVERCTGQKRPECRSCELMVACSAC